MIHSGWCCTAWKEVAEGKKINFFKKKIKCLLSLGSGVAAPAATTRAEAFLAGELRVHERGQGTGGQPGGFVLGLNWLQLLVPRHSGEFVP